MNYTLDTDAIRNRLRKAVIGIRADGSMAVLVKTELYETPMYPMYSLGVGKKCLYDMVSGKTYTLDDFPTLIRPGDECECSDNGKSWVRGVYNGCEGWSCNVRPTLRNGNWFYLIRPVPAAKPELSPELVKMKADFDKLQAAFEVMLKRSPK